MVRKYWLEICHKLLALTDNFHCRLDSAVTNIIMGNLHNRLKVKLGRKNEIFTTARKRILNLVELQSL